MTDIASNKMKRVKEEFGLTFPLNPIRWLYFYWIVKGYQKVSLCDVDMWHKFLLFSYVFL